MADKFIDIAQFGFQVEPRYFQVGWTTESRILGRPSAIQALLRAQKALPEGLRFKVWDMQRTLDVQLAMIESFRQQVKIKHPDWSEDQVMQEVYVFASKPLPDEEVTRPDCHRNGGAVDLTIVVPGGQELDMGTDHDDLTEKAATLYFHELANPTAKEVEIRDNRQVLIDAMQSAGWEMLPTEWWHWSITE